MKKWNVDESEGKKRYRDQDSSYNEDFSGFNEEDDCEDADDSDPSDEDDHETLRSKFATIGWSLLTTLLIIFIVALVAYIAWRAYDYYHIPAYETGVIEDVDEPIPTPTPTPASDDEEEPEPTTEPEYSSNTVGYLTVPGVDVTDDPVLQHPTIDDYYLTHDEYDQKSIWGAYFVPSEWNMSSIEDLYRVTVIFGHSNGNSLYRKFSVLKHFRDVNFASEHRYIYLTIGDEQSRWKIFAAADYPVDPSYTIANPDDDYFLTEIQRMKDLSYNQYNVEVGVNDKILILSTCTGEDAYETRFILCAKLDAVW